VPQTPKGCTAHGQAGKGPAAKRRLAFCIFSILKVWCRFVGDSEKRFWSKNDFFFRDEIQLLEILELKIGT
jgi:hypothetical protein